MLARKKHQFQKIGRLAGDLGVALRRHLAGLPELERAGHPWQQKPEALPRRRTDTVALPAQQQRFGVGVQEPFLVAPVRLGRLGPQARGRCLGDLHLAAALPGGADAGKGERVKPGGI